MRTSRYAVSDSQFDDLILPLGGIEMHQTVIPSVSVWTPGSRRAGNIDAVADRSQIHLLRCGLSKCSTSRSRYALTGA